MYLFLIFLLQVLELAGADSLCGSTGAIAKSDYIFLPNSWGDNGSGRTCIDVDGNGSSFSATWSWSSDPYNTHAYPSAQLETPLFPVPIQNLTALNVQSKWTMALADSTDNDVSGVIANVALDLFADTDVSKANVSTEASAEVMIWIGSFGSPQPLGYHTGKSSGTYYLGDLSFSLFIGTNQRKKTVYSWLAAGNIPAIQADIRPLLQYMAEQDFISSDIYIGSLAFGSETFFSSQDVTFSVSDFQMELETTSGTSGSKTLGTNASTTVASPSGWVTTRSSATTMSELSGLFPRSWYFVALTVCTMIFGGI